MAARITSILPREQAGAQTGRKYEFQYEEAALACLKLLEEGSAVCVYCEWHDDFVVEHQDLSCTYAFYQVKTRADTRGAWSMFEVLGVKRRRVNKAKPVSEKSGGPRKKVAAPAKVVKIDLRDGESIAQRMLVHHRKFKDACALFVLVSPTEFSSDPMLALVKEAKSCGAPSKLPPDLNALFVGLLQAYQERDSAVTEQELWALLERLQIELATASESEPRVTIGLMGQMIHEFSEVNLTVTEQSHVADSLLKVVRERSHAVLKTLPAEDEVRTRKSISLREVIRLLPLSLAGYERLKQGDKTAVKTLSRLQRLCQKSGMSERLIEAVCGLKVDWHAWRARVGDSLTNELLGVLQENGLNLLRELTSGKSETRFQDLQKSAETTTARLSSVPRMPTGLTANILMGLVFALAAESE